MEKNAFAITREGHKLDASNYQANADYINALAKADDEYGRKAPVREFMRNGMLGTAMKRKIRNKQQHNANLHKRQENSINPFVGWSDAEYNDYMKKSKKKLEKKAALSRPIAALA